MKHLGSSVRSLGKRPALPPPFHTQILTSDLTVNNTHFTFGFISETPNISKSYSYVTFYGLKRKAQRGWVTCMGTQSSQVMRLKHRACSPTPTPSPMNLPERCHTLCCSCWIQRRSEMQQEVVPKQKSQGPCKAHIVIFGPALLKPHVCNCKPSRN